MKKWICMAMAAGAIGCGEEAEQVELERIAQVPKYGVVSSDRTSAAIGLLDEEGEVIERSWLHSGTASTGLSATLSGDVVLPTEPTEPDVLAVIDRLETDVLTRIRMPEGEVLGQVKTHRPVGMGGAADAGTGGMETGYSSNPQDYLYVDEDTAWVTRHKPNVNSDAPAINRGSDMLEIDPSTMTRTGNRIDFSALNTTATTMPEDGEPEEVTVYAMPSRMVKIGDHVVVGLARLSADFGAAGEGMVALVDLEAETVEGFELSGLANCLSVYPLPDADDRVLVACDGFAQPYGDPVQTRMSSGLIVLSIDDEGEASIELEWRPADYPDAAITTRAATPIGDNRLAVGTFGDFTNDTPDRMYLLDMESGEQELLFETETQVEIGDGAYDPDTGLLLLPDASSGVRRYRVDEEGNVEDDGLVMGLSFRDLPPRMVRPLK